MSRDIAFRRAWAVLALGFLPNRCGETSGLVRPERSHETCGTMSPNQTPREHHDQRKRGQECPFNSAELYVAISAGYEVCGQVR